MGAALGLSALLLSSALAFSIVKYLGAAYLVYLGLRRLLARDPAQQAASFQRQSLWRIFRQGVIVAILNPKTALFFLAFLPQFVDPARGSVTAQLLTLGLSLCADGRNDRQPVCAVSGQAGHWLKSTRSFVRAERYVVGSVYIGLGVTAALADAHRQSVVGGPAAHFLALTRALMPRFRFVRP